MILQELGPSFLAHPFTLRHDLTYRLGCLGSSLGFRHMYLVRKTVLVKLQYQNLAMYTPIVLKNLLSGQVGRDPQLAQKRHQNLENTFLQTEVF